MLPGDVGEGCLTEPARSAPSGSARRRSTRRTRTGRTSAWAGASSYRRQARLTATGWRESRSSWPQPTRRMPGGHGDGAEGDDGEGDHGGGLQHPANVLTRSRNMTFTVRLAHAAILARSDEARSARSPAADGLYTPKSVLVEVGIAARSSICPERPWRRRLFAAAVLVATCLAAAGCGGSGTPPGSGSRSFRPACTPSPRLAATPAPPQHRVRPDRRPLDGPAPVHAPRPGAWSTTA